MGAAIIFAQRCPACDQFFNVRIRKIGSWVPCPHCRHEVVASAEMPNHPLTDSTDRSQRTGVSSDSSTDIE